MKKIKISKLKNVLIILFVTIFISCETEDLSFDEVSKTQSEFKFIRDNNNEILDEMPTEILLMLFEEFENSNQKIKGIQLRNTYNFKTGKLNDIASEYKSKISIQTKSPSAKSNPTSSYQAHVRNLGWLPWQSGGIAGTTGESRRMEALRISDVYFTYRAHVRDLGWLPWVSGGNDYAGTVGESRRMEAVKLFYDHPVFQAFYRVHVRNLGWLPWRRAGKRFVGWQDSTSGYAGTVGQSRRMEAFQLFVVDSTTPSGGNGGSGGGPIAEGDNIQ